MSLRRLLKEVLSPIANTAIYQTEKELLPKIGECDRLLWRRHCRK